MSSDLWPLPSGLVPVARLGEGGEGEAWLARDPVLDRLAVCKRLNGLAHQTAGKTKTRTVLKTLRTLAARRTPGVPVIYGVENNADGVWMVAEYMDGVSLSSLFAEPEVPASPAEILFIAAGLATSLATMHAEHLMHGDVTPGNVVVSPQGNICLVDFGLAALFGEPIAGGYTPAFAAPEVLEHGQRAQSVADVTAGSLDSYVDGFVNRLVDKPADSAIAGTVDGPVNSPVDGSNTGYGGFTAGNRISTSKASGAIDCFGLGCVIAWLLGDTLPKVLRDSAGRFHVMSPNSSIGDGERGGRLTALLRELVVALTQSNPDVRPTMRRVAQQLQREIRALPLSTQASLARRASDLERSSSSVGAAFTRGINHVSGLSRLAPECDGLVATAAASDQREGRRGLAPIRFLGWPGRLSRSILSRRKEITTRAHDEYSFRFQQAFRRGVRQIVSRCLPRYSFAVVAAGLFTVACVIVATTFSDGETRGANLLASETMATTAVFEGLLTDNPNDAVVIDEVSPSTVFPAGFHEEWVLTSLSRARAQIDGIDSELDQPLRLRISCADQLCQIVAEHHTTVGRHWHQQGLIASTDTTVWQGAIRDLAIAAARY